MLSGNELNVTAIPSRSAEGNDGTRVSILMLVFDRPHLIDRAIESILKQDYRAFELIVVHDGPNNQIEAAMREWLERDSRIRYFRRSEPGNIANALNFGLQQACGEYVAILDDDDYWLTPRKLSLQVAFLDNHSS